MSFAILHEISDQPADLPPGESRRFTFWSHDKKQKPSVLKALEPNCAARRTRRHSNTAILKKKKHEAYFHGESLELFPVPPSRKEGGTIFCQIPEAIGTNKDYGCAVTGR